MSGVSRGSSFRMSAPNVALRDKGDHFIGLIRDWNAAATAKEIGESGSDQRFNEALAAMHQSVDRMGGLAGKKHGPEDD